jgi:TetR/AcrR family transcriptional regulator, mexJK operon transcriptional repressor
MKGSTSNRGGAPAHPRARSAGVPAAAPRRGGRPSRAEAEQLGERILDAAAALFFSAGYGATTIEAVVERARISKRTFYHRFEDKPALFSAVVHRTITRMRPPAEVPLLEGANLQEILQRLAGLILRAALSPQAIALHRLIVAESARFPNLAAAVNAQGGTAEAIALIAGVLERESRAGRLKLDAPAFAAQQFLHMVVSWPQSRALRTGKPMTPVELDAWSGDVVNLFLNGCRGWKAAKSRAS